MSLWKHQKGHRDTASKVVPGLASIPTGAVDRSRSERASPGSTTPASSHSITAVRKPAVMAGGGQVAAEPVGDLLVDVSSDHQPVEHPPPIELPRDFHTLSEEEQVELLMVLTKSREKLRGDAPGTGC